MRKGEMLFLLGLMPIITSQGMNIEHPKMADYDGQDESQPPQHIRPHLESAFIHSKCDQDESLEKILTPCPPQEGVEEPLESSCISLDQYCDGWPHCPGGTDEDPMQCRWKMPIHHELRQLRKLVSLIQQQFLSFIMHVTYSTTHPYSQREALLEMEQKNVDNSIRPSVMTNNIPRPTSLQQKRRMDLADRASRRRLSVNLERLN